jgi:hypothetical protein
VISISALQYAWNICRWTLKQLIINQIDLWREIGKCSSFIEIKLSPAEFNVRYPIIFIYRRIAAITCHFLPINYTEIDEKWENWRIVFWLPLDKNEKLGRNEWISLLYELQGAWLKLNFHQQNLMFVTLLFSSIGALQPLQKSKLFVPI